MYYGESHAKATNELLKGIDRTYNSMRKLVENDSKSTVDEKLICLEKLAKKEAEAKRRIQKELIHNKKEVGMLVQDLIVSLLTFGLSFTPKLSKS